MARKVAVKDFSLFDADDVAFLQEIKPVSLNAYNDPECRVIMVKINTISHLLRNVKTEIRMELPHTMPGLALWWRMYEYKESKLGNSRKSFALVLEQSTIFSRLRRLTPAQLKLLSPYLDKFLSFVVQKLREKHTQI